MSLKKTFALLTAAALALSMLAACSGDKAPAPSASAGAPAQSAPEPAASVPTPERSAPASSSPAEEPDAGTLNDGSYTVEVALEGGSGKTTVASPAVLRVEGGQMWATIVWSSSNYDYMKVDGVQYDALSNEDGSTFEIPVAALDQPLPVVADTVAMGNPHEIEYTLTFDSSTVEAAQ